MKQTRYILQNLRSVFDAAGCGLGDVVKSQVFLTDLKDFYYFDQVWKEFFPSPPPRTTVQIGGLLVPGCRVEIDLTAVTPAVERRVITGSSTPTPMAHYCQGVLAGDTLYAAGQIASDYRTGVPPAARQDPAFPYYGSDIQKQTRYVLENIQAVYRAAGCELEAERVLVVVAGAELVAKVREDVRAVDEADHPVHGRTLPCIAGEFDIVDAVGPR